MRTRPTSWIDIDTLQGKYGLQVLHKGKWRNLAENGKPCVYDTQEERDAKRREYSKIKAA